MQHILIVDDDPDLLEMITLVLVSQRHKVTTASCGAAVAGALDGPLPDLILMDIYLGDADGRDLCRQLKDSSAYGHVPVLLYSAGYIQQESIAASGADDFIAKPFDIYQLRERIDQLILQSRDAQKKSPVEEQGDMSEGVALV
ncbi:response regulator transcription factor [Terrimonas ferruginea]|uniref:response regulator transcription factor n=1 Tax=Terrimonas ferruginea TaxID=249 RepID=UPI0006863A33|nr:response regulator [Terrimonas ferruginea]